MRTRFVERDTSADNGDTGSRHLLVQIASGPDPRDLPANHGRGAHEAAGNPHSRIRNAFDNRFRDVDGELGTRTATERNEHRPRVTLLFLIEQIRIEQRKSRTRERCSALCARVHRDAAVDDEIGVEATESQVVHADDEAAGATPRGDPSARGGGNGVVDNEHVRRESSQQMRRAAADNVTTEGQGGFFHRESAAQRDQWTHAKGAGQRAAAHQVTEAPPGTCRCAKQNPKVSAGCHDMLR